MINIQNIDNNEYFKWCIVRYSNPADHHPVGIVRADKDFSKIPLFKDISLPVKTRDFHKAKKRK